MSDALQSEFFGGARRVIEVFDAWVRPLALEARADHLCFKCGDSREFENWRSTFEGDSRFVYQSIISQRRIAIIKFKQPLPTILGDIWFLELSDQKPDGSQTSGFDHIEIFPTRGSVEDLVATLELKNIELMKNERPHHTTYDVIISGRFTVRLEPEALIEKITRMEMR